MSLNKKLFAGGLPPVENAFNVVTYTGDGASTKSITGVGFKPDMVWVKARSSAYSHNLQDSTRGGGTSTALNPNLTLAEGVYGIYGFVNTFDTDGFTVGTGSSNNVHVNNNGTTYVAWCWRANEGSTSSSAVGSITSSVQANADAGFSIVRYTGNSSSNQTIGHGLSVIPKTIIVKKLGQTSDWAVYHTGLTSAAYRIKLNSTDGELTSNNPWNSTDPTSSVFTVKSDAGNVNANGQEHIAYCFADIEGFSKFDSYTGTGSAGHTINVGFAPAFVIVRSLANAEDWLMFDSARGNNTVLYANTDAAEATYNTFALTSTGFELPQWGSSNGSGQKYIYMAWGLAD